MLYADFRNTKFPFPEFVSSYAWQAKMRIYLQKSSQINFVFINHFFVFNKIERMLYKVIDIISLVLVT